MKHLTYGNLLHKMKRIKYKRNYKRSKLQKIMKLIIRWYSYFSAKIYSILGLNNSMNLKNLTYL